MVEPITREDGSIDWTKTKEKVQTAFEGFPPDPDTGAPAFTAAYNQLWEQEQERAILKRMEEVDAAVALPGSTVGEWIGNAFSGEGAVIDAELAKSLPCTRIDLGDGAYLCYAEGVNGALSDAQEKDLCVGGYTDRTPTPVQKLRLKALADGAATCSVKTRGSPEGSRFTAYHMCLGDELRKAGVKP